MRGPIALLVLLSTFSLRAQEPDLDFGVVAKAALGARVIPIEVSIPAEELRFVEERGELVARFSVRAVAGGRSTVLETAREVKAPLGTTPAGVLTPHYEVRVERDVTAVDIVVRDENARVEGRRALFDDGAEALAAKALWLDTLARAERERKPIVVFHSTRPCSRCRAFERATVPHPAIQRRLPAVVFAILPGTEAGLSFFDRRGVLRARWPIIPDTTDFGIVLDSVSAVAADFERAAQLADAHDDASELEAANGLARLGRVTDARAALARARTSTNAETQRRAIAMSAILDVREDPPQETPSPNVQPKAGAIRVLPLAPQVVRGRQVVRTKVDSPSVARVAFSLDGREVARVTRPPFSATLDFGEVPERHTIRAVALDRKGTEVGRHERIVNDAGEKFWLHFVTPREGTAGGNVQVSMNVRVPSAQRITRIVLSWNDAERAVLQAAPWDATIRIPEGEAGVLRAVAELDDGRATEDVVLLNAGVMGRADVLLAELPMTIADASGAIPEITPSAIIVREGDQVRRVESVANAAETPLTVGLLIDVSASMQASLLDVQEAAIGFLESILGPRDRAFVITFDTRARLVQPATSDVAQLRRQIMTLRPDGLTAIHDAMVLGLLQFEGVKGRRAMVVFTDGLDLTSEYKAADVRELARRVSVPIHVIASTPGVAARLRASNAPHKGEPPNAELSTIARATGGSAQALDDLSELSGVYARIEAALRGQILAFVRTDPGTRENEWRPITVKVKGRDLVVFAPEGYYAMW